MSNADSRESWPVYRNKDQMFLLETAESIAGAEAAKRRWNPKANRDRYLELNKCAVSAANLAIQIGTIFPRPWDKEKEVVGELVGKLVALVDGTLQATIGAGTERYVEIRFAGEMVKTLSTRLRRRLGRAHWELIRDLVWLASGKRVQVNESTIRRYLKKAPQIPKTPAHKQWNRHWKLLVECARLVPTRNHFRLRQVQKPI